MGIPYYFYVITQKYRGILHSATPEIDYYFFDFNGIIHPVCRHVMNLWEEKTGARTEVGQGARAGGGRLGESFEDAVCAASWKYARGLESRLRPVRGTGIFIDGVAPVAKINQQRKRRYLSILRYKMEGKDIAWDTNAISPGTEFMGKITDYLRQHAADKLCVLSTADENGEGEHKIFEYVSKNGIEDSRIAIHGLDADLIMLSLLSHHPRIHLVRENKSSTVEEPSLSYLDITALRFGILREFTEHGAPIVVSKDTDVFSQEARDYIESYVVTCFLLGNDFLPHLATLSLKKQGMDKVMRALCETQAFFGATLVDSQARTVNFTMLHKILDALAATEDADISKVNEDYLKQRAFLEKPEDAIEYYPIVPKNKARVAQLIYNSSNANTRWRSLYYKELFGSKLERMDSGMILTACRNFMVGVVWTYRYYKRMPKDAMWYYPYNYGPTLLDLANFLFTEQPWLEALQKRWDTAAAQPNTAAGQGAPQFVNSDVQLLSIMPLGSAAILPTRVQKVMTDSELGCTHLFPVEFPIQTYLKTHLWECTPILPPIDFKRLAAALKRAS